MPIARITTNVEDADTRSKVAQAIAECFLATGVSSAHVTTLFTTSSANDLYVAGDLFSRLFGNVGYALVQVGMSATRPDEFRAELAEAITSAFAGAAEATRVSIDFVAREGVDAYVGGRALARRTTAEVAGQPRVTVIAEQVRAALHELDWGDEVLTANDGVLLSSLAPDWIGDWDSLAAIETSQGIEEVLQLPPDVLNTGQQDYAEAFGSQATLGALITFVIAAT